MYVISVYADAGDYEILFSGEENEAKKFFDERLAAEIEPKNVTSEQYEIWVDEHYQNDFKPGVAYTVKLVKNLPAGFH